MPRQLILVTEPRSRLAGATTIQPGYPKDYTPGDMRTWAEDLERLYGTSPWDLVRWRSLPQDELAPEQRRVLAVQDKYFTDPERGIKGSLRDGQKVDLDGGRHRAGYLLEKGLDPVPVWVWAADQRQLDALRERCEDELERKRVGSPTHRSGPEGRTARAGSREANVSERGDRDGR